ncbi:MAG TPA: DsbC family protein [Burkholderiaceae bacterium]|nr:DsbC family protein [Burkholderiaceae bacterium]
MRLELRRIVALGAALMCALTGVAALAQNKEAAKAPPTGTPEAQVAARFAERAGMKPDQVFRGPAGLYEVLVRGELYYVDPAVTVVIMGGHMFDARTREDLTQKRLDTALKVDFKSLPLDRAVKLVRGNGSRVLVTFEDPNCPYCKRLWQNFQQLNNVTIYTFLYPILSPDSQEKARAIWCAKDRGAAWEEYMVQGKPPAAAAPECKAPLEQNLALGKDFGINGTPTLIFADGSRGAGAMPLDVLEQRLTATKK